MSRRPSRKQTVPADRRGDGARLPGNPEVRKGPDGRNRAPAAAQSPSAAPPQKPATLAALCRLDWAVLAMLAAALLIAPLFAGTFAVVHHAGFAAPAGAFDMLTQIGTPLAVLLAGSAGGVAAWQAWQRTTPVRLLPVLTGAAILVGLWAILSLAHTRAPGMSLNALAALLAALLLGGLVVRLSRDGRAASVLVLTLALAASIVSLSGIFEYAVSWFKHDVTHRTFATFLNPDFLAGYLLLTLPVTLAAFTANGSTLLQALLGASLGLQSACLLLTGSRAGVGILLAVLLAWLALAAVSGAARLRWGRIGAGLALFAIGTFLGLTPTRARITGVVHTPPAAPGSPSRSASASASGASNTLADIESAAAAQGYSAEFRRYTWLGALHMALANPLIGAGIGSFEVSYPHYALTAYTAHAHNSYLQWASETGFPGLLFLLALLAAVLITGTSALLRPRQTLRDRGEDFPGPLPSPQRFVLFDHPALLLAGLLAGIVASLLHSLFDSDWYIVATLFTFSAILGLTLGMKKEELRMENENSQSANFLHSSFFILHSSRPLAAVGAVLTLFLLWRSVGTAMAAIDMASAAEAVAANDPQGAAAAYQEAIGADPLELDARLDLSALYTAMNRPDDARRQLEEATQIAPIGKTFYRLGQFDAKAGDLPGAIRTLERAREIEPHNLQTLHALGDVYDRAGDPQRASHVFAQMAALENAPYGKVRAIPTLIETEFAYAHAGLADIAYAQHNWAEAAQEYARAAAVLKAYWDWRWLDVYVTVPIEKRNAWADLYDEVLTRWQECLQKLGPEHAAEAAHVEAQRTKLRAERAAGS